MIKTQKAKKKNLANKDIFKNKKGITLIALVITIIVLLILAAVSIATLTGDNGLLNKAQEAKIENDKAGERDQIQLAYQAAKMEEYQDTEGTKTFADIFEEELEKNGLTDATVTDNGDGSYTVTLENGNSYIIDENGNITDAVAGPNVEYSINPETQVTLDRVLTITITATATEGEVTKITKPDGTTVENTNTTTYEVEENGDYTFTVEQGNGGVTVIKVTITNGKEVEKFSDIYSSTTEYKENGVTVAWIPKGFAVGTSDGINSVEDGLVITDEIDPNTHQSTGNEFVWIPVEITEEEKAEGKTFATKYPRTKFANNAPTTGLSSSYTEPYANGYEGENEEYQEMIDSVTEHGGFYVGRYEAGCTTQRTSSNKTTKQDVVVKKGAYVYNYVPWGNAMNDTGITTEHGTDYDGITGAVELSKNFATQNGYDTNQVTSTLIYGIQWDMMLRYVSEEKSVNDSNSWGNYDDSTGDAAINSGLSNMNYTTGRNEAWKAKNIYDIAGNVYEWTMEAYYTDNRVDRGGYCNNPGSLNSASYRYGDNPYYSSDNTSFRPALIL